MSGIEDLVVRDPDGNIEVWDHKTKSNASMKKEYQLYRKQLYLYALHIHEEYGVWPVKLCFNMVKDRSVIEESFDPDMVGETMQWFIDTIRDIETCDALEDWTTCISDKDYDQGKELYFCKNICGVNPSCERYQDCHYRAIEAWKTKRAEEEAMSLGYI